jgi:hypothetical protein
MATVLAATADLQILQELATDDSLKPLLEEDFDPKAFATRTIQCQTVGEMLVKLVNGIAELDNELYTQVVTHYEDLLSQATGIEALESVLKMMHSRIDSLTTAVDRISSKIIDPYQKIISRTAQLTRLQSACDLLRKIIRMLYLIKRVKTQMQGGLKEISKVAQTFNEIDQLTTGNELVGIEVIDNERAWLQRVRKEVESQAKKMLIQGLESLNPTHVGVALQVFYNLGQLEVTIVTVLTSYRDAVQHEIQNGVDPSSLLQSTGSLNWKASLWARLEKLTNALMKLYKQVHQLETILLKKRDPVTHVSFLSYINGTEAHVMLMGFWEAITDNVGVEFSTAAKASIHLNQTFENDYPKLLKVFADLLSQVEQLHAQSETHSHSFLNLSHPPQSQISANPRQESLIKSLSQFEKVYISRSLSRLIDSVNHLFSSSTRILPREEEILSIVQLLASELTLAGSCVPLIKIISNSVIKAIQLFNTKCEKLVLTGKDSLQISGPPNHSQFRNIAIVNTLHRFHALMQEYIVNSTSIMDSGKELVQSYLEQSSVMKIEVMMLFIEEVQKTMKNIIASLHRENFSTSDQMPQSQLNRRDSVEVPHSGFVKELLSFTTRIFQEHFSHYICQEDLRPLLVGVAQKTLEAYVKHVCLIRPLNEGGKMRITSDMAQV